MPSSIIANIAKEAGSSGVVEACKGSLVHLAGCSSAAAAVGVLGGVAASVALPLLLLTGGVILEWHRDKRRDAETKAYFEKLHAEIERLRQAQQSQADPSGLMDELFRQAQAQAHSRGNTFPQSAADVDALMSSIRTEIVGSDKALLAAIDQSFEQVRIYLSKISDQLDRIEKGQQQQTSILNQHGSALDKLLALAQTDDNARRAEIERELRLKLEAEIEAKLRGQFGSMVGKPIDEQARELAAEVIARLHDPAFVQRIREVGGKEAVLEHFEGKALEEIRAAEAHLRAAEAHAEAVVQASIRAADWAMFFGNITRAAASLDNALRLRPRDPALLLTRGRVATALGNLDLAEDFVRRALPESRNEERLHSVALQDHGDMRVLRGDLTGALTAYEASLKIREALCGGDEKNSERLRDLSASHSRVGNVRQWNGDLAGALVEYEAAHKILEMLCDQDKKNAEWQRDLSVSHNKIGDVRLAQGDLAGALATYEAGLKIAEALARQDEKNAEWQRDVSVSRERIGDVRMANGDLVGALMAYDASLKIREVLCGEDEKNAAWKRDLSVSHNKIGDVCLAQRDFAGALAAYEADLKIMKALCLQDEKNAAWQRDLSASYDRIGNVRLAQSDLAGALTAYEAGLKIARALCAQDGTNAEWQRDLSVSHQKIADVRVFQGDLTGALAAYKAAIKIAEALSRKDKKNAILQRDLAVLCFKLGVVACRSGSKRLTKMYFSRLAKMYFTRSRDIAAKLVKLDPTNATWRNDLAIFENQLRNLDD